MPCHGFFSSDGTATDCAVCLEAFEAGDRCRLLPRCGHSFHAQCVDPWLEKSRCCPVCRADVVPRSGELVKVAGEGALAAAQELAGVWLAEKLAHGETVPPENTALFAQIDVSDAVHGA